MSFPDNLPSQDDTQIADLLKAVGHPVRLRIVRELIERSERCCGDMCACFDLSQSTISQHLSVLKEAGIVSVQKKGTMSCFSVDAGALDLLQSEFQSLAQAARANQHDR